MAGEVEAARLAAVERAEVERVARATRPRFRATGSGEGLEDRKAALRSAFARVPQYGTDIATAEGQSAPDGFAPDRARCDGRG